MLGFFPLHKCDARVRASMFERRHDAGPPLVHMSATHKSGPQCMDHHRNVAPVVKIAFCTHWLYLLISDVQWLSGMSGVQSIHNPVAKILCWPHTCQIIAEQVISRIVLQACCTLPRRNFAVLCLTWTALQHPRATPRSTPCAACSSVRLTDAQPELTSTASSADATGSARMAS